MFTDFNFFSWLVIPSGLTSPHFLDSAIILSNTTHGRTPLDKVMAHRNNQHTPATDMPQRDSSLQFQQASGRRHKP
jgi:hypothetical protein